MLWLIQCFFFPLVPVAVSFVGLFLYFAVYLCAAGDYGFITQKLWEQALTTTVINGMKVFPHPIVGFNQLKSRIQNQRERAKKLSTSTFPKLHQVSSCLCTDQLSHVECCLVVVVLVVVVLFGAVVVVVVVVLDRYTSRSSERIGTNESCNINFHQDEDWNRTKETIGIETENHRRDEIGGTVRVAGCCTVSCVVVVFLLCHFVSCCVVFFLFFVMLHQTQLVCFTPDCIIGTNQHERTTFCSGNASMVWTPNLVCPIVFVAN